MSKPKTVKVIFIDPALDQSFVKLFDLALRKGGYSAFSIVEHVKYSCKELALPPVQGATSEVPTPPVEVPTVPTEPPVSAEPEVPEVLPESNENENQDS